MVYESDFYTTRRPYSRPTITSYSVTNSRLTPGVGKAHTYHPSIPFIAHKKLTNATTPVPHNQVRKTVISNTLDRIHYRPRSHPSYDPMEDFLNERSVTSFEDVTRSIRANTAALLKQVHTPIPRAVKPLSVSNLYNHTETPISERISSDEYIWHLLRPLPGKPSNGIDVGYYPETSTRIPLGKTHLACLSYAGGHPISKRRQLVAGAGDDYRNVRNDVELLSHYTRMRNAANLPHENGSVKNEASNDGASRFKYNASTTPHTTEKVIANGPTRTSEEAEKENITFKSKPLRKAPSKTISVEEEQEWLKEKQAEEDRLEQELEAEKLEQERKAEKERLEQERKAEQERIAEQERKAEEERLQREREAEEERLEQERRAEEERIAEEQRLAEEAKKEEEQRLLEEKLIEEYHKEQERLKEEQRILEQQYAEEQQRLAQEKLAEEQRILHDKLMEIKQQQEAEEVEQSTANDNDEPEEEKVEENDSEYVTCNNIPKDSFVEKKNESAAESEASEDEEEVVKNIQQNGSIEVEETFGVNYSIKSSSHHEEVEFSVKVKSNSNENDDEKSENTDANSEISEGEDEQLNDSSIPADLNNHVENNENDKSKANNKEESEEEEEEEDEVEEDEEEEEE